MQVVEFIRSESGAITTDWVFISAGVVALGMASTAVVTAGVENLSDDIAQALANDTLGFMTTDWGGGGAGSGFVLDAVNRNGSTLETYQGYIANQVTENYSLQDLYDYAYTRAQQPDSEFNDRPDWIDYLAVIENEAQSTGAATVPGSNTSAAAMASDWRRANPS